MAAHLLSRLLCKKGLTALACGFFLMGFADAAYAQDAVELKSSAFASGGAIPRQYSCEGEDYSPPLSWTGVPHSARSLALIVDDPDAPVGTWVHWVVYNLPAELRKLDEKVDKGPTIAGGGQQGRNDFRRYGYGGPCPPPGPTHHYHFRLYALDASLDLKSGATAAELKKAMEGHVVAGADLVGTYRR